MSQALGKVLYGTVFVLCWPAMLALLAMRLDASRMPLPPQPVPAFAGIAAMVAGGLLMVIAMGSLWRLGKGLPMNAFPPTRFVTSSVYALFSHPIYVGFVLMVAGISVWANSPSALWIVTPLSALACVALVLGYEGPELRRRFGPPASAPWFGLPLANAEHLPLARRIAAGLSAYGPWVLVYCTISSLPAPPGAVTLRMGWEYSLPHPAWAIWPYTACYVMAIAAPLVLRSSLDLRRFVAGAWLATAIGYLCMLSFPVQSHILPRGWTGLPEQLAQLNFAIAADWLAFPSFHAMWAEFAALALTHRYPRLALLWQFAAVAVGLSCVLTGAHAILDIPSGMLLAVLYWHHARAWLALVRLSGQISNSWNSVQLGPVRIISHAAWSGIAASAGSLLVLRLAGPTVIIPCAVVIGTGLLCAGAWGYWLEGGHRLSRPFGYYGFLLGGLGALIAMACIGVRDLGPLTAGFAAAAPLAQAIGRLRCMVQGCCHGRPAPGSCGICVTNPMSRVTALGKLTNVPIYPTQLYSVLSNLVLTVVFLRLWAIGATWPVLTGLYLGLSSLARFVEEQYRGEPQTARWHGLAIYQWLAIAMLLVGIMVMMVHGDRVVLSGEGIVAGDYLLAIVAGVAAAFLMSVDFPGSTRRFSRLTVNVQ